MIPLPWNDRTTPNVMLEITNACNLKCRACYATLGKSYKSLETVREELETARTLRPIDTVTLTGGEPLLHPSLADIIRLIADQGLQVFLLTNGVRATPERLKELKDAGLSDILFHVDFGQDRGDLPRSPTLSSITEKFDQLIRMGEEAGLDPSVSFTLYEESAGCVEALVDWFLDQDLGTMLFLADAKDPLDIQTLDRTRWNRLSGYLKERHGLSPFAYIPPTGQGNVPVWYSYFIPIRKDSRGQQVYPYQGSGADRLLMGLGHLVKGRHTHRMPKSEKLVRLRVFLHGLFRFRAGTAYRFLSRRGGASYRHKMIVYDGGPYLSASGERVSCSYCPTAIVRNGALVKCCEMQPQASASA